MAQTGEEGTAAECAVSAGPAPADAAQPWASRYLSVGLGDMRLAIPLDRVIGVIEAAAVTPIPFSPAPFEGLVQAMGMVIPQISLASLLGLAPRDGGILVVVSDIGGSVALRVDQVHAMFQLDRERMTLATAGERARQPTVLGTFGEDAQACTILNLDQMTSGVLAQTLADAGDVLLAPGTEAAGAPEQQAERAVEPYLAIGVSGFIYAVAVAEVVELIELSSLRPVPHAPGWVAGLVELRGEPVLGLSLSRLLTQPDGAAGRIGVMIARPYGRVVLIAERSLGIERYADDQIHAMEEPVAGIASYLVRADGAITGVIDPAALLAPIEDALRGLVPRVDAAAAAGMPVKASSFRQMLTMRAGREVVGVALDRIHRLQAAVQVTPIPDWRTGFDGLADVGDAVVPVIDLRRILSAGGAPPPPGQGLPPCLLAMIQGSMAGLVVDQVLRIETVAEDQLMPTADAPNLPVSEVMRLNGRMLPVISLERLLPQR